MTQDVAHEVVQAELETADVNPFATTGSLGPDEEDLEDITGGRYRLPDLTVRVRSDGTRELVTGTGRRKGGWQRVTTLVKAIGDARALDLWHQRELLRGLILRPDLYDLACSVVSTVTDPGELRKALESLATRALVAAGTDAGANTGSALHGFTEAQDLGMIAFARKKWHSKLANYRTGLQVQRLEVVPEYVERRVAILKYGLVGTLDRLLWDEVLQVLRVGDLKSQKAFWGWLEISAQLAAYQMADAMWDRAARRYVDMPPVAADLAVVAWMPIEHPDAITRGVGRTGDVDRVDFFDVDLSKGRAHLELCHKVDRIRSEARSKGQTIGLLRPAPELTIVEAYASRLSDVASAEEGSALWAEIITRGLSDVPELQELARESAQRFVPVLS
jgi:hypothetical protein